MDLFRLTSKTGPPDKDDEVKYPTLKENEKFMEVNNGSKLKVETMEANHSQNECKIND